MGKLLKIADMPTPRESFGACVARHFIVTAGGLLTGQKVSNVVEWYHTSENRWASLPPLPVACHGVSIQVYNENCLIAVGGQDEKGNRMNQILRYNMKPQAKTW